MKRTRSSQAQPSSAAEGDGPKEVAVPSGPAKKFLLLPENLSDADISIVQLRHPKTDSPALFSLSTDGSKLFEVLNHKQECSSWFVGQEVVEDGCLKMLSPVHPFFLVLPYLLKNAKGRFIPIDQLLEDSQYPLISRLEDNKALTKALEATCDTTAAMDLVAYKYNEGKTTEWLKARVEKLKAALITHGKLHQSLLESDSAMLRYVHGMISDYLPPSVSEILRESLSIPLFRSESEKSPLKKGQKKRKAEDGEPTENYYSEKSASIGAKPPELTTNQKKLKKASVGTKALTSFFTKKSASTS